VNPFVLGSLITGGTALLGGFLGNQQSAANTSSANAANRDIASDQMAFQERMSNTAYQRATTDMRMAGINPMLAYQQGGASSPSGAGIAAQAAPYSDPLGPAVSTGVQAYRTGKELDISSGQLGVAESQNKLNAANSQADIALKAAQVASTVQSAKNAATQQKILESRAKREKLEGDWYGSDTGKTLYQLDKINQTVGGVLDSANSATSVVNPFRQLKDLKKLIRNQRGTGTAKDGTRFDLGTGEVIP